MRVGGRVVWGRGAEVHHASELVRVEARLRVIPATCPLQPRSKGLQA